MDTICGVLEELRQLNMSLSEACEQDMLTELVNRNVERIRSRVRRQRKRLIVSLSEEIPSLDAGSSDGDISAVRAWLTTKITGLQLSEQQRKFVRLWLIDGIEDDGELAAKLGVVRERVSKIRYNVRCKLKSLFNDPESEWPPGAKR